jgi:N-methylhydantoinase B
MTATGIDPITFEVVRGKLAAITDEQALTLKAVSGSPVVTEATDFNNGLYLADGSIATMGRQVLFHTGTMSVVIEHLLERFGDRAGGIEDGDMFIVNDPYRGAVHQPDVSIMAPIFHDGEHVAWAGSCAHQLDVGGMSFGSWAVGATEVQQEAMLLPGIKLVRDGELQEDLWQMIMGMSRLPHVLALDLKAMIAANHVAGRRLTELIDRYGSAEVQTIMRREIELSERALRERLSKLPDGTFQASDFLEHDGHTNRLYEIALTLTKHGDELTFDFAGSSPQAPGFINCTRSGLVGAVMTAMLPILAPDIRWNQGALEPVTITAPEGSICNATRPAPVSAGTVSAVWVVTNVAVQAISRLAACGPETATEATAVTKGSMWVLTMAGADRDGGPFGTFLLDSTIGGAGAYLDHDGLDASGEYPVPRPAVANVESNERSGPYLYLYRRLVADTGGPGRTRGGVAAGVAVTPHDAEALHAMLIGHGVEVPNSVGLFGGIEAGCNEGVLYRGAGADADAAAGAATGALPFDAADGDALAQLPGAERVPAKLGHFELGAGDVIAYAFQGGGGYGDPLERAPAAVARDVENGFVSVTAAAAVYGVAIDDDGSVHEPGTALRRAELRRLRLGGAEPSRPAHDDPADGAVGGVLVRDPDGRWRCRCGFDLGPVDGNFKDRARTRVVAPHEHGPRIRLHEELELREHCCPACATLLESEVARRGQPSRATITLTR